MLVNSVAKMISQDLQKLAKELELNEKKLTPESIQDRLAVNYHLWILEQLENSFNASKPYKALKELLADNWDRIKGSSLCYTAEPEHDVTLLLCRVAEALAADPESPDNETPLKLLMPGIHAESLYKGTGKPQETLYPDLTGDLALPLKEILRTHILDDAELHLIPVRLLGEFRLNGEQTLMWGNPYHDAFLEGSRFALSTNEIDRLLNHSQETETLGELIDEYKRYINKSGFLDHLNKLIRHLADNSVIGKGSEELAGESVYAAIIRFNEFYRLLDERQIATIPHDLKEELKLLMALASNAEQNSQGAINFATCIDTRKNKLIEALAKADKGKLNNIGINEVKSTNLLNETTEKYAVNLNALMRLLNDQNYNGGIDQLSLSYALLEEFEVKLDIIAPEDFEHFMSLSANEIDYVLQDNDSLQEQVIDQLYIMEDFVIFCLTTHPERLKAVLSHTADRLGVSLFQRPWDLSNCISMLHDEALQIFLDAFKVQIHEQIRHSLGLEFLFNRLTTGQCVILCRFFLTMPQIMASLGDLVHFIHGLETGRREALTPLLAPRLSTCLSHFDQFIEMMLLRRGMYSDGRKIILNALEPRLLDLARSGQNITALLRCLTITEYLRLCRQLNPSPSYMLSQVFPAMLFRAYYFIKDNMQDMFLGVLGAHKHLLNRINRGRDGFLLVGLDAVFIGIISSVLSVVTSLPVIAATLIISGMTLVFLDSMKALYREVTYNHYTRDDLLGLQSQSEQQAVDAAIKAKNWKGYFNSFTNYHAIKHPVIFSSALSHNMQDEEEFENAFKHNRLPTRLPGV